MKLSMMSRLAVLEAASPEQAWRHTEGLYSLLAYARAHPLEVWEEEAAAADDPGTPGLAGLLARARYGMDARAPGRSARA